MHIYNLNVDNKYNKMRKIIFFFLAKNDLVDDFLSFNQTTDIESDL